MKKLTAFVLAILFCVTAGSMSFAAVPPSVEPQYERILSMGAYLDYIGNGKLNISGSITAQTGKSDSVLVVLTLQKMTGDWTDVDSWRRAGVQTAVYMDTIEDIEPGIYRLQVVCSAYWGVLVERETIYSDTVLVPAE